MHPSMVAKAIPFDRAKFYVSAFFNLLGLIVTILFIPNILGLDLREGDVRWEALYNDDPYYGEAINPQMLSLYERMIGYGKQYNPQQALEMARQKEAAAAPNTKTNVSFTA
jgi:hypothetical protein